MINTIKICVLQRDNNGNKSINSLLMFCSVSTESIIIKKLKQYK